MTPMTRNDIRAMHKTGAGFVACLIAAIRSGIEYPDAEYMMRSTLMMRDTEVADMIADYDDEAGDHGAGNFSPSFFNSK
jgi:hypothetical protein